MSDSAVLTEVTRLAANERLATPQLVAALAELDARRLYLGEGCSSLFTYCTHANHRELLTRATHKSKREIEVIVAAVRPQTDLASSVRKMPAGRTEPTAPVTTSPIESTPVGPAAAPIEARPQASPSRPVVAPVAPDRYKVQFTISRETQLKLRRVQDLMRHTLSDGDPAAIFDRGLTALLAELERAKNRRIGATSRGSAVTRKLAPHLSAVKRVVWKRDAGRCAFQGARGRCDGTGFLEFGHLLPAARPKRRTSSCDAAPTISTKRNCSSARLQCCVKAARFSVLRATRSRPR